ncbi:hypothetical protein BGZ47_004766 [Haplosporangium gracile]|nr:hypothetical protein BGZ47_004766 [Haplosporangium gracile]
METTLPTYTPSPIPVPVFLYSPSRPDAVPCSPAIRLHPAGSTVGPASTLGLSGPGSALRVTVTAPGGMGGTGSMEGMGGTARRLARFADDGDDIDGGMDNNSSRYSPSTSTTGRTSHQSNNVAFQTRSRGYTTDSAHSAEFPTFAVYRQSQHGNFEALAQRFKRAFAISQQTNEQQQQQLAMMQSPAPNELSASMSTDPPSYAQTTGDQTVSSCTAIPLTATTATSGATGAGTGVQTRSRSASAASMFSDIAGRLRSGSLFSRSSTTNNIASILPNSWRHSRFYLRLDMIGHRPRLYLHRHRRIDNTPLVHDSNNNEDEDEGDFDEDVFTASPPQSQSHLVSIEKHSEKPSEPTLPNSHHR